MEEAVRKSYLKAMGIQAYRLREQPFEDDPLSVSPLAGGDVLPTPSPDKGRAGVGFHAGAPSLTKDKPNTSSPPGKGESPASTSPAQGRHPASSPHDKGKLPTSSPPAKGESERGND